MVELLLLTLFVGDDSRMDSHLSVGSCSTALRQSAGVDDEYAVDDLDDKYQLEKLSKAQVSDVLP